MPRLLIITPDFPPAHGGIQVLAHRLATGIEGFESRVVTLDSPGSAAFDATGGLRVRRVSAGLGSRGARNLPLNAAALLEALAFRPHLTLSTHIVASPAAALIRRTLGARSVQYFHAKEIADKPALAKFAARQASVVIAVSTYTAGLLAPSELSSGVLRLIPPGVDLPADPPPPAADPGGPPTFVTIARLADRYKGHDVVMAAMPAIRARVPGVQWAVVGDGPLRPELEAQARSLGVADAVTFLGGLPDDARDAWLARSALLAMPSRLPQGGGAGEGFGIVYLEAGARGKPVVGGNVAGALDSVLDGRTGLLVDPTDPAAVAEAITSLLLDAELAERLGRAGAERAASLSWPLICRRVQDVLSEQMSSSRRRKTRSPG